MRRWHSGYCSRLQMRRHTDSEGRLALTPLFSVGEGKAKPDFSWVRIPVSASRRTKFLLRITSPLRGFGKIRKMKKIYIIHGWGGSSEKDWIPWLETELKKKRFKVKSFDMPDSENPKIEKWIKHLELKINPEELDENSYFVGHSVGCQTIMRYLEKLHKHKKIGGCVFVAPWFNLINLEQEELEIAHPWTNTKIDFSRILDHCNNFLAIFSDNDPFVHSNEIEKFKNNLGAKTIIKKKKGHFTSEDGVKKIPEILDFLK